MSGWKHWLRRLGPGFITGAADDDPSGIGTYAQTGAMFGYDHLWLSPCSFPLMVAVQETCARIGMVTGRGLSAILKAHYPRWVLHVSVTLLLVANTVNIAADLGAMAASVSMLTGLPFTVWIVVVSVAVVVMEVVIDYRHYSSILRFLSFSLLAYVVTALIVAQDWPAVLSGLVLPTLQWDERSMVNVVAFLGTSISPYLFFWQSSQEVEEEIVEQSYDIYGQDSPSVTPSELRNMRIDTVIGMAFSQLSAVAIVLTAAATFHVNGITDIETAPQAAQALRPLAGDYAYLLFSLGIIGTGLLGVPVLAGSSAYALSESWDWKRGLGERPRTAPLFYAVIAASTLVGLAINFTGINPMKALYYAAVVNGLLAPPLMVVILLIGRNRTLMGAYRSGWLSTAVSLLGTLLMGTAALYLLVNLL